MQRLQRLQRLNASWRTLVLVARPGSRASAPAPRAAAVPVRFSSSTKAVAASIAPASHQPVQLRNYQEECIQSVLSSIEQGQKRLGISLATGAGKTVVFTQLLDRIKPDSKHRTKTLILAHRRELVEQAARHCSLAYPDKTVDIEMGKLQATGMADITVASVQSIISGDRIHKFDPRQFKLVLVDEAHHIVSPGYLRTLEHFRLDQKRADSPVLVGVSATFSRFDGLRLGTAIDEIVYHKDYVDMIGEKWLSDVIFTTVESKADLSRVRSAANGDFALGELSRAVNTAEINEITVRSWLAKASGRKSTLVFCADLEHVAGLTQKFREYGLDARFVTGDTPNVERSERLDAFKRGDFPVLVNCGVFTEGTDIPNIDCVVLARPTRSRNLLVQMIGRGMRLFPGKKDCHVIDMVSSLATGIVTTPTLFGLDPYVLVEETTVGDMRQLRQDLQERKEAEEKRSEEVFGSKNAKPESGISPPSRITFTEYDSVFDLISDTSGDKHIRALSRLAWVQVGPEKYILSFKDGAFIRIERDEAADGDGEKKFAAWEVRPLPRSVRSKKTPFAQPRRLLEVATLTDAVHGADSYAVERYVFTLIDKNAKWRYRPASEGQLQFLNKLRSEDDQLSPEHITMGKAGDMITKVKHGARGRFTAMDADRRKKLRKEAAAAAKAEARKQRETVRVGPLEA